MDELKKEKEHSKHREERKKGTVKGTVNFTKFTGKTEKFGHSYSIQIYKATIKVQK